MHEDTNEDAHEGLHEEKIKIMNRLSDYCELVGVEPLHPLVSVVDFSRLPPIRGIGVRRMFGYYAVYLKGDKGVELHYGRSTYSYEAGTLVFFAPGQVVETEDDGEFRQLHTRVLMFHPDLLKDTCLAGLMDQYSYFSYHTNECLHPTDRERELILDCFSRIEDELRHFDSCSLPIVIDYIKLVLDCCVRFYNRQFAALRVQYQDILARLEQLIADYFNSDAPLSEGVPTVAYCADRLHLSPNYFNDLVRQSTGLSALKLIHRHMLDIAKIKLSDSSRRINEVAEEMGFRQPQNFSKWFKKMEGCRPGQYGKERT